MGALAIAIAGGAVLPEIGHAQSDALIRQCRRNVDQNEAIAACTSLIQNPGQLGSSGDARRTALSAVYTDRGRAYMRSGDNERALADLESAVTTDPKNSRAFNLKGDIYVVLGDNARALQEYDRAGWRQS
jgi:Tfp pilus assembly protein PilF